MNYNIEIANLDNLEAMFSIVSNEKHSLISFDSLKADLLDKNKLYIIAKNKNDILAFLGIAINVDSADIECVIVKKEYRRQNIAFSMFQYIIQYCKKHNVSNIFLEVRESNFAASTLYKKLGFEQISIRKKYYQDNGENALIYMLKI